MFYENFIRLCNEHHISPNGAASDIGYTSATVTKWKRGATPHDSTLRRIGDYFGVSPDYLLSDEAASPETDTLNHISKHAKRIPVLGEIPAGLPLDMCENILDYEEIPEKWTNSGEYEFFALQVKGNSMEPKISPGDIVIVRVQSEAHTGDTVVVRTPEGSTLKRYKELTDTVCLIPNNPSYDVRNYKKSDITIIGKVMELRSRL